MVEGVVAILQACLNAAKAVFERKAKLDKERQQLALLTAQFCFIGIAETGEKLLQLAGPHPLLKLKGMSVEELKEFHALVQRYLSVQLSRLQKLQGILNDQQVIDLFDPTLRSRVEAAIGNKREGLYSVGAALFFYFAFNTNPKGESTNPEEHSRTANLITCMYPEEADGTIAMQASISQLNTLREGAKEYAVVVREIIPASDFPTLSERAKQLSKISGDDA